MRARLWACGITVSVGSAALLGVYLAIIHNQGNKPVAWVIAILVAGAMLPLLGAAVPRLGVPCFLVAAVYLTVLTILGALSIGILVLPFTITAWVGSGIARSIDHAWRAARPLR